MRLGALDLALRSAMALTLADFETFLAMTASYLAKSILLVEGQS
jgi:hypothetical protein